MLLGVVTLTAASDLSPTNSWLPSFIVVVRESSCSAVKLPPSSGRRVIPTVDPIAIRASHRNDLSPMRLWTDVPHHFDICSQSNHCNRTTVAPSVVSSLPSLPCSLKQVWCVQVWCVQAMVCLAVIRGDIW